MAEETPEELLQIFWQAIPDRVTEATELWLEAERGDVKQLEMLQRLLHSIKGEAQMLGLESCELLAQHAEDLVEKLAARDVARWPTEAGTALLTTFERFTLLMPGVTAGESIGVDDAVSEIRGVHQRLGTTEASADEAPQPERAEAAPADGETAPERASTGRQVVDVDDLDPLVSELRRLYAEQTVLYPQLREVQQMVRTLLKQIDPKLSAEELKERIVKTLGFGARIERRLGSVAAEWSANEFSTNQMIDQLEQLMRDASLVSLARLRMQIHRAARGAAQRLGKEVVVDVRGDAMLDAAVERKLGAALMHMVRNAVDHGIESAEVRRERGKLEKGTITVTIARSDANVRITVEDDGGGIDFHKLREELRGRRRDIAGIGEAELIGAIFEHGVSTQDDVSTISGRGVGLDVVSKEVTSVGGRVHVESSRGVGTRFVILVPASLRVDTVIPVTVSSLLCGVPSRSVRLISRVTQLDQTPEGPVMWVNDDEDDGERRALPVRSLGALLGQRGEPRVGDAALVVERPQGRFVVTVDEYDDPRPLSAQPDQSPTVRTGMVQGVVPSPDGGVLLLLDVAALHESLAEGLVHVAGPAERVARRSHVLVVEDTPVARALLCGILRSFGYRVSEAIDGQEGLSIAEADRPDLILTDIEMPVMGGLEMLQSIRRRPELREVPAVVLSTRSDDATKERAASLGVRHYLPKRNFTEESLKKVLGEVLGES